MHVMTAYQVTLTVLIASHADSLETFFLKRFLWYFLRLFFTFAL